MVRGQGFGDFAVLVAARRVQPHVVGIELHEPQGAIRQSNALHRQPWRANAHRQARVALRRGCGVFRHVRLPHVPLGIGQSEDILRADGTVRAHRRRHIPAAPVAG